MISLTNVVIYLIKNQKYTLLYLFAKKILGPRWVHPYYNRPSLTTRLMTWIQSRNKDYFFDTWELC
jgi:hypothetical protein